MTGIDLNKQVAAMEAVDEARRDAGLTMAAMERGSGVPVGTFYHWKRNTRSPLLPALVSLADTVGLEVVLSRPDGEVAIRDQKHALTTFDAERRARGMSLLEIEIISGISVNSYYAWRKDARSPSLCNFIALAETFDFTVMLRRRARN